MTAKLKRFTMISAFGTDHVQASCSLGCDSRSHDRYWRGLLMQWLADENVVGILNAPQCGSASRARSIPLKRKRLGDPQAPKKRIAQSSFCGPAEDLQGQQVVFFDIQACPMGSRCRVFIFHRKTTVQSVSANNFHPSCRTLNDFYNF